MKAKTVFIKEFPVELGKNEVLVDIECIAHPSEVSTNIPISWVEIVGASYSGINNEVDDVIYKILEEDNTYCDIYDKAHERATG